MVLTVSVTPFLEKNDVALGKEQVCVDQTSTLGQLVEKVLQKEKSKYLAFMDSEEADIKVNDGTLRNSDSVPCK